MIVQCDQCNAKFKLDETKMSSKGVKVRCSKCRHVFSVKPPSEDSAEPQEAAPPPPPTPDPPESEPDFDDGLGDFAINEEQIPAPTPDEPEDDAHDGFELKDDPEPEPGDDDKLDFHSDEGFGLDDASDSEPAPEPPAPEPPAPEPPAPEPPAPEPPAPEPPAPEPPAPEPPAPESPPPESSFAAGGDDSGTGDFGEEDGSEEDFGDFDFGESEEDDSSKQDDDFGSDMDFGSSDAGDKEGFSDESPNFSTGEEDSGGSGDEDVFGGGDAGDFNADDISGSDPPSGDDMSGGDSGLDTGGFDELGGTADLPDEGGSDMPDDLDNGFSLDTSALGASGPGDDDQESSGDDDMALDRGIGGMGAGDFEQELVQGATSSSSDSPKDNYEASLDFGAAADQPVVPSIPPSEARSKQETSAEEEASGEQPAKVIPPYMKKKKVKKGGGSKVLIFLLIVLMIFGGAGFLLYATGKIDMVALKTFQNKPSVENLKNIFLFSSGKEKIKDVFATIVTSDKELRNTKAGRIFVLEGNVVNHFETLKRSVLVEGRLLDENGNEIKATAYIGETNIGELLDKLPKETITALLNSPTAVLSEAGVTDDFDRMVSKPGEKTKFMIVFFDLPDGPVRMAKAAAKVISYKGVSD